VDALLASNSILGNVARNELDHLPPGRGDPRPDDPWRAGEPDRFQVPRQGVNGGRPGSRGPQRQVSGAVDLLALGEGVGE
jgi:hypothetical protein